MPSNDSILLSSATKDLFKENFHAIGQFTGIKETSLDIVLEKLNTAKLKELANTFNQNLLVPLTKIFGCIYDNLSDPNELELESAINELKENLGSFSTNLNTQLEEILKSHDPEMTDAIFDVFLRALIYSFFMDGNIEKLLKKAQDVFSETTDPQEYAKESIARLQGGLLHVSKLFSKITNTKQAKKRENLAEIKSLSTKLIFEPIKDCVVTAYDMKYNISKNRVLLAENLLETLEEKLAPSEYFGEDDKITQGRRETIGDLKDTLCKRKEKYNNDLERYLDMRKNISIFVGKLEGHLKNPNSALNLHRGPNKIIRVIKDVLAAVLNCFRTDSYKKSRAVSKSCFFNPLMNVDKTNFTRTPQEKQPSKRFVVIEKGTAQPDMELTEFNSVEKKEEEGPPVACC